MSAPAPVNATDRVIALAHKVIASPRHAMVSIHALLEMAQWIVAAAEVPDPLAEAIRAVLAEHALHPPEAPMGALLDTLKSRFEEEFKQ